MGCDLSAWAALDPVYLEGIAGVLNLGANVMICYFRWEPGPSGILERVPAMCAVRPMTSICSHGSIAKLLIGQNAPKVTLLELMH